MNETNCPFCGAERIGMSHDKSTFQYECGTWWPGKQVDKSRECYERQIASLRTRLKATEQELEEVKKLATDLNREWVPRTELEKVEARVKEAINFIGMVAEETCCDLEIEYEDGIPSKIGIYRRLAEKAKTFLSTASTPDKNVKRECITCLGTGQFDNITMCPVCGGLGYIKEKTTPAPDAEYVTVRREDLERVEARLKEAVDWLRYLTARNEKGDFLYWSGNRGKASLATSNLMAIEAFLSTTPAPDITMQPDLCGECGKIDGHDPSCSQYAPDAEYVMVRRKDLEFVIEDAEAGWDVGMSDAMKVLDRLKATLGGDKP